MTAHTKSLSERYQEANVKTAGVLKSWLLLLEKANQLLGLLDEGNGEAKIPLQNILVQLQTSLNLKEVSARDWHKSISIMWDTVELGDPSLYPKVQTLLGTMYSTMQELQTV